MNVQKQRYVPWARELLLLHRQEYQYPCEFFRGHQRQIYSF